MSKSSNTPKARSKKRRAVVRDTAIRTLARRIRDTQRTGKPINEKLRTAQQVLARITEGIYRQPSSALRELISNAYDADAKRVVILTDAPRFAKVVVRDDGNGLTPEALANLIRNIGASPKQSRIGAEIGVTDREDVTLSQGGRKLIGRLGIGLFSVAQLTRHFQVITKTKGSNFRAIADITLNMASEEGNDHEFDAGDAQLWIEPAKDIDSHGTEIILLDLRKRTRDELASVDRWERLDALDDDGDLPSVKPPLFHIGRVSKEDRNILIVQPSLPWTERDQPALRFRKLTKAIMDEVGKTESNPSLENTFDNYLQLLWTIGLAAPLSYIEQHPFDLPKHKELRIFELSNDNRGQAREIELKRGQSSRSKLKYIAPERVAKDKFDVFIDGIQLFRPIRFTELPSSANVIQSPLLFVGKYSPRLTDIPNELSGGPLSFEAYLFWTPVVVPKEHRGVMVRIGDASGTLFDSTFMGYQVSEQTRLRQLTAELYVLQGLDAAINIDRESFNYAHPHYQLIVKWLHNAIKQFTNKHKEIGKGLRETRLGEAASLQSRTLQNQITSKLKALGVREPPEVVLVDDPNNHEANDLRNEGVLVFSRTAILPSLTSAGRRTRIKQKKDELMEQRVRGFIQLLDAWGVLEGLPYSEQQKLVRDLLEILTLNSGV
jgi:hypothetical protein